MYTFYVIIITTTPFFACSFLFLSLQSITTLAYVKKKYIHNLCNEREHGLSVTRIILELLAVVLVFLDGPDVHLTGSDDVEEQS